MQSSQLTVTQAKVSEVIRRCRSRSTEKDLMINECVRLVIKRFVCNLRALVQAIVKISSVRRDTL